jgi:hypothetical protein
LVSTLTQPSSVMIVKLIVAQLTRRHRGLVTTTRRLISPLLKASKNFS